MGLNDSKHILSLPTYIEVGIALSIVEGYIYAHWPTAGLRI